MGLFKKQHETVSVSTIDQNSAVSLYDALKAAKLKNVAVSQLASDGESYQFTMQCENAETMCNNILPLIYAFENPSLFEMIIQFEDKTGKAKSYPKEVMTSFRFDSGQSFGNENEQDFITKLRRTVSAEGNATVDYVIMSGGAVTISIPSAEPEKIQTMLADLFESYPITLFEIKLVSRESA